MRIVALTVVGLAAAWLAAAVPQPAAAGDRHPLVSRFGNDVYDGILNPRGQLPRHAFRHDHSRRHLHNAPRSKAFHAGRLHRRAGAVFVEPSSKVLFVKSRHARHDSHGFTRPLRSKSARTAHLFRPPSPHLLRQPIGPRAKLPRHRVIHRLQGQRWTAIGQARELGRTYVIDAHDRRLDPHTLVVDGETGNVLRVIRRR